MSISFQVLNMHLIVQNFKWKLFCRMKPRLENPSFKPAKGHILAALDSFVDILKIRYSSPLFRLSTASDIKVHVFFISLPAN